MINVNYVVLSIILIVVYSIIKLTGIILFRYIWKGELEIKSNHNYFSIFYKKKRIYFNWIESALLLLLTLFLAEFYIKYNKYIYIYSIIIVAVFIIPYNRDRLSGYVHVNISSLILYGYKEIIINGFIFNIEDRELKFLVKHHATQRGGIYFTIYLLGKSNNKKVLIKSIIKPDLYTIIDCLKKYAIINKINIAIVDDFSDL